MTPEADAHIPSLARVILIRIVIPVVIFLSLVCAFLFFLARDQVGRATDRDVQNRIRIHLGQVQGEFATTRIAGVLVRDVLADWLASGMLDDRLVKDFLRTTLENNTNLLSAFVMLEPGVRGARHRLYAWNRAAAVLRYKETYDYDPEKTDFLFRFGKTGNPADGSLFLAI